MPKQSSIFDDKTIFSTPTPIHSSSMSADKQKSEKRTNPQFDDTTERLSDAESSLGILSMESLDISKDQKTRAAERLQRERVLAVNSLNRCEANLTSLPSRFLKPSEVSASSSKESCLDSDSTISESDLLPGDSSTPRDSLRSNLSNLEFVMQERQPRGSIITKLALSMSNSGSDFGKILEQIHKTIDPDISFCPGEEAINKLEQDELSWKKKNDIPAELQEFSLGRPSDFKMSMGSFFQRRSDSVADWLAKSPVKNEEPVPLIEASSIHNASAAEDVNEQQENSLSISAIAQILSDTKHTPTKALNFFMQSKTRSKSPTIRRPSSLSKQGGELTRKLAEISTSKNSDISLGQQKDSIRNKEIESATYLKSPTFELSDKEEVKENTEEATKENINILNLGENLSPDCNQDKSVLSSRSTSSLSSLPNGKLPVATTKTEIVWGCVKPGKNASQDFIIKNKSPNRLGIRCSVSNPSFRLIREGSDSNFSSTMKVILHPYESRTVTVTFAPTALGAAVDSLYFSPINSNHNQQVKQFIRLFGYGGYGNITINNVVKDTTGKFLLSLGNVESQEMMKKTFTVKNNGTLPSFAYIGFVSNGLYLFSNVKVSPQTVVLLPEEEREVIVSYSPKREDLNYIQSKIGCPVMDIGKLTVIYGTEVDRGRLRKLCKKANEKGLEVNAAFNNLLGKFPGEVMPSDLKLLREPLTVLDEILRLINTKEVVITLEQDLDRTICEQFQNETAMFHSLCENTNTELFENTVRLDVCHVEPSKIILTPPGKVSDMIFLSNSSNKKFYFEVNSSPEGLRIKPSHGTVDPGETVIINLTYTDSCKGKSVFQVKVLVDNECYDVDVKVMYLIPKLR